LAVALGTGRKSGMQKKPLYMQLSIGAHSEPGSAPSLCKSYGLHQVG